MRTEFATTIAALRRLHSPDAAGLHAAAHESMPELLRWLRWCEPEFQLNDCHGWIRFTEQAWYNDTAYNFAIVDPGDNHLLGSIWLSFINRKNRHANVGYWVRTSATKRGIATAATRLLAEFAFSELDLNRVEILIPVENLPSLRVAEKVGAVREGVLRERIVLNDRAHDAAMFSLLAKEH